MEKDDQQKLLRKLYTELSDDELREISERLDEYLDLALRIYDRVREDPTRRKSPTQ